MPSPRLESALENSGRTMVSGGRAHPPALPLEARRAQCEEHGRAGGGLRQRHIRPRAPQHHCLHSPLPSTRGHPRYVGAMGERGPPRAGPPEHCDALFFLFPPELGWSQPCDVWSIGCIIFEYYVGFTLFQVSGGVAWVPTRRLPTWVPCLPRTRPLIPPRC